MPRKKIDISDKEFTDVVVREDKKNHKNLSHLYAACAESLGCSTSYVKFRADDLGIKLVTKAGKKGRQPSEHSDKIPNKEKMAKIVTEFDDDESMNTASKVVEAVAAAIDVPVGAVRAAILRYGIVIKTKGIRGRRPSGEATKAESKKKSPKKSATDETIEDDDLEEPEETEETEEPIEEETFSVGGRKLTAFQAKFLELEAAQLAKHRSSNPTQLRPVTVF